MSDWSDVDSRSYIVAFELRSPGDCPEDFHLVTDPGEFEAGLFLPRDDPDWFGRSAYPPHVLLLTRDRFRILPHPSARAAGVEWPLASLSSVEAGHMLLKGWLHFAAGDVSYRVRYNTRGLRSVSGFMCRLRRRLLGAARAGRREAGLESAGLDVKFDYALRSELDAGESIVARFFQAPTVIDHRMWLLPGRRHLAGDLLVLSDRRIVWITDRYRGFHSRYGAVTSYAPLGAVERLEVVHTRENHTVAVRLHGAPSWEIPIDHNRVREAIAFAGRFDGYRRPLAGPAKSRGFAD